ncbi:CRTAC1 family protein [Myxococcota bacterium]|nr:CRTAC1 family protein [Myxococcota bacterium]
MPAVPLALTLLSLFLACKDKADDTAGPSPDGGATAGDDTGTAPGCEGTAGAPLPEGLTELAWDDGVAAASLPGQGWAVGEYSLEEERLHEWVRFEPQDTVRVHGISVQLVDLPEDPLALVELGLYADFGYNGFDAWGDAPLWTGTRCAGELAEEEWVTFTLDEPVEVQAGSLVYAGHLRQGEGVPAIPFDAGSQGDGTCATWDDCHSAMNLPDLTYLVSGGYAYSFWKGYSFSLQYDYLVRLHVEVVEAIPADDKRFQRDEAAPAGSRQAWGDFDGDGWEDLYVPGALYHNQEGTLVDVTSASGLAGVPSSGGVWGDHDNDGCLDLFVFAESTADGDSLFRGRCDGSFEDVTVMAGLDDSLDGSDACGATHRSTAAAAWLDLDGDGWLDLYTSNFICWSAYTYYVDQAWHNDGDGTFTALGGHQGFTASAYAGRGAAPVDADRDGDVDLLVNNYVLQRNLYYDNQGDGTVDEDGTSVGLAGEASREGTASYYGHTIGAAWGDLDNDGDWDSVQANLAHPRYFDFSDKTQILLQDDGEWTDNAGDWEDPWPDNGLRYQETHSVPTLGDFDSDGALDLAISAVYDGRPTDLYWGDGDGTFTPGWHEAGITTENGWGMSAADWDNDGDLDLATSGGLFENTGPQGHWLQVRPLGVTSNRAAIGATVTVEDDTGVTRMRQVQGGTGQGEQDGAILHFGLGEADSVARITVAFVGGEERTWEGPFAADQRLWLWEDGSQASGWAPPAR